MFWPAARPGFSEKRLSLKGAIPRLYLEPGGQWLKIVDANPYQIEAQLPDTLVPGEYKLWAHNVCRDVGNHSSLGAINRNMGEQFMFHIAYDPGGIFRVSKATERTVTFNLADPRLKGEIKGKLTVTSPAGTAVRDEVGKNDYWIVFICAGRGVGQWRVVSCQESPGGNPDRGHSVRVAPDASSRVVLTVSYRQNIVYANTIQNTELDREHKNHGVIFWCNGFDNIVAANRFHNQTAGVVFNHGFRNPTAWNLTRDNVISQMYGMSGDTSRNAALYVDHLRWAGKWPVEEDRVRYSVGDIVRNNRGDHATVGAYVHTRGMEKSRSPEYPPHPNGGMMLKVLKHPTIALAVGRQLVSHAARRFPKRS